MHGSTHVCVTIDKDMNTDTLKTPAGQATEKVIEAQVGRSLWDDAWSRLKANRAAMASFVALFIISVACFIGPILSPHDYDAVYRNYVKVPASLSAYPKNDEITPALEKALKRGRMTVTDIEIGQNEVIAQITSKREIKAKSSRYVDRSDMFQNAVIKDISEDGKTATVVAGIDRKHFYFGTDANGRDLMTRTLIAGRVSLIIGLLASGVALLIGVTYGSLSGYFGGRVDLIMMRVVDVLYSLPFIFFVILLVVFFGRNFILMFIAVGAVEWLDMARIVRGQTLSIKRQEYVLAAEANGRRNRRYSETPHHSEHLGSGGDFCHAVGAESDPSGKLPFLPRSWCSRADDVMGCVDLRGCA